LLHWHYHLSHLGFRKIQLLMWSGMLSHTQALAVYILQPWRSWHHHIVLLVSSENRLDDHLLERCQVWWRIVRERLRKTVFLQPASLAWPATCMWN
jgi:hypothetical protein